MSLPPWSWDVGGGVGSTGKELVEGNGASRLAARGPSGQHVVLTHIWLPVVGIGLRVADPTWHADSGEACNTRE